MAIRGELNLSESIRMKAVSALPLIALSFLAAPAAAQLPDGGITFYGEATAVSDYRYRGISRSDENPALQGSLTVQGDSGFYVGAWGSTLDGIGDVTTGDIGDVEPDTAPISASAPRSMRASSIIISRMARGKRTISNPMRRFPSNWDRCRRRRAPNMLGIRRRSVTRICSTCSARSRRAYR